MAKAKNSKKAERHVILIDRREGDDADQLTARTITRPEVQAAGIIHRAEGDSLEINAVIRELEAQGAAIRSGDMGRVESLLAAQAHSLDALFGNLARRASINMKGGYRDAAETYFRLAFKAQAQCRTTCEALAEIKNPRPVAFVRQANIANGPQQVNNAAAPETSRAGDFEKQSIELLEARNAERLDAGAPSKTGLVDKAMEAVGTVNRSAQCSR